MTKALARDQHRSLTELLIGYRRGLWFNMVTSNDAQYEDDDGIPDLDLVPFEDEVVAAAA